MTRRWASLFAVAALVVALLVGGAACAEMPEPVQDDGIEALRTRANAGDAEAQLELGTRYLLGVDGPEDSLEAWVWYHKAAEQGLAEAQYILGYELSTGCVTLPDPSTSFPVPTCFDNVEATAWYRLAAEQGHMEAQFSLGEIYDTGDGVPEDFGEAAAWYRQAAEQGHTEAQINLGYLYSNGRGVPQDYVEAVAWYRRAAEQGGDSLLLLGLLHASDKPGLPNDNLESYKWFSLGATLGVGERQSVCIEWRDKVAEMLTPEQLAEGQRRAREWFEAHPR